MDPLLRPAVASDVPAVSRIWREGWRDGHLGHVPDELVVVRTAESFAERTAERIPQSTVAEVEGEVVGFITVVGDEAEQVYVDRTARGTGVAAVLLDEAARQIAAAGYPQAWLAVAVGNDRARRFYGRAGWVDQGVITYAAEGPEGPLDVPCHRYVRTF